MFEYERSHRIGVALGANCELARGSAYLMTGLSPMWIVTVAALDRANIDAVFPAGADKPNVDFIVNNIAGCGAMLRDYAHLLRDDKEYAASH